MEEAARLLLAARASGEPLDTTTLDWRIESAEESYAVQALVLEELGPAVAWKVGARSPEQTPTYAPLPSDGVRTSPVALPPAERGLGIEVEIGYRLAVGLPPRAAAYERNDIIAAVGAMLLVVEYVESRLLDRVAAGTWWSLADFQLHGALALGAADGDWRAVDLSDINVRLAYDGKVVVDRAGRNAAGDTLGLVVKLANLAGDHGGGLRAGQVITTGSLMGIEPVPAGAKVEAEVTGLGAVAIQFGG